MNLKGPPSPTFQFCSISFKVCTNSQFNLQFFITNSMYKYEGFNYRQTWELARGLRSDRGRNVGRIQGDQTQC